MTDAGDGLLAGHRDRSEGRDSRELIQVSIFLAAFSGLYFTVSP